MSNNRMESVSLRDKSYSSEALPTVSVICPCFNNAKFLHQCIGGLLDQKVSFPVEIIIRDDCSTDGSIEILKEYHSKFPHIIKLILEPANEYALGKRAMPKLWEAARGEYLASCECDDYWTDPNKLQSQVEFLDAHPECVMVTHNATVVTPHREMLFSAKPTRWVEQEELIQCRQFATGSICFRKFADKPDYLDGMMFGDTPLFLAASKHGRIYYDSDRVSSVYNRHPQGITATIKGSWRMAKNLEQYNRRLDTLTNSSSSKEFDKRIANTYWALGKSMKQRGRSKFGKAFQKKALRMYPGYRLVVLQNRFQAHVLKRLQRRRTFMP